MQAPPYRVLSGKPRHSLPLYGIGATRALEAQLAASLPPHSLMQRAGLATARLALALAPHTPTFWIACGPGNNGGDGLEAALHLHTWGKRVWVTNLGTPAGMPVDAAAALHRALAAGVVVQSEPPVDFDFCIDALLGLGMAQTAGSTARPLDGRIDGPMAEWIRRINASAAGVLAVDLPSGLQADTGVQNDVCVRAHNTLSLLTLKPGLFTAQGRDASGDVWLDSLQKETKVQAVPDAWLLGTPQPVARAHAAHKGSFGDVAVVGGAPGMVGAAWLAARAAQACGAGRVYVGLCAADSMADRMGLDSSHPELMFRKIADLPFDRAVVVIGCGGGNALGPDLARALSQAPGLVADADALNLIAQDKQLQKLLQKRSGRGWASVLTPHPLEAARLLQCNTAQVQSDRLAAAQLLAAQFDCAVVLKGSGSVVAAPACVPIINPTGSGSLAGAGTGDVLAGMVGAALARMAVTCGPLSGPLSDPFSKPFSALQNTVADAVHRHGDAATNWPKDRALPASHLLYLLNVI